MKRMQQLVAPEQRTRRSNNSILAGAWEGRGALAARASTPTMIRACCIPCSTALHRYVVRTGGEERGVGVLCGPPITRGVSGEGGHLHGMRYDESREYAEVLWLKEGGALVDGLPWIRCLVARRRACPSTHGARLDVLNMDSISYVRLTLLGLLFLVHLLSG